MKIMKTLNCKSAILLALLMASGVSLRAQTLREEDQKEFKATGTTELKVDNQFGTITVNDWDQDKVSISWIIQVTDSDEARAKKTMEKIKVEVKEEGNQIIAKTTIGNQGNLNLHNGKDDKRSFSIDYVVKCPKNIKVNLDNQFGDIKLATLTGQVKVDLQFGSLNAVSLTGQGSSLDMQFGEVTIGTLLDAKIDIQHCESLKINEGGVLNIDAQFTKLDLGTVTSLDADLNNCEFEAENIKGLLKLESNMGSVKVLNVDAGFKALEISQNMGDVSLAMDPKAGYQLDAEVNMGSIKVPEGMKLSKSKDADLPGVTAEKVKGTAGTGGSMVKIKCNMGSVKIR